MKAYFEMIKFLVFLFAICSLIMLPAILHFESQPGINDGSYSDYSLGSTFSSHPACFSAPFKSKELLLSCGAKELQITEILSVGIIGENDPQKEICSFGENYPCKAVLDEEKLKTDITKQFKKNIALRDLRQYIKTG